MKCGTGRKASVAEKLFQKLGTELEEDRNDFYEDTAVFYAKDQKSLWINYAGGTYELNEAFSEENKVKRIFLRSMSAKRLRNMVFLFLKRQFLRKMREDAYICRRESSRERQYAGRTD